MNILISSGFAVKGGPRCRGGPDGHPRRYLDPDLTSNLYNIPQPSPFSPFPLSLDSQTMLIELNGAMCSFRLLKNRTLVRIANAMSMMQPSGSGVGDG